MRKSASEIIRNLEQRIDRLEGKTARSKGRTARSNRISATTFEVRVQEEVRPGKWRTVKKEKMTLAEIKRFMGTEGDFTFDPIVGKTMQIVDNYEEPTQKLNIELEGFLGGVLKG